jgi:hypothetical protein
VASNGTVPNHFVISAYPNEQSTPDLAFNGQNYLAVWSDRRDEVSHIYYTRINQSGTILNPAGIKLSGHDSSDYYSNGVVASNGNNYLVSYLGASSNGTVALFSMINSAGSVVDTIPVSICGDTFFLMQIITASDGQGYLVAWTDYLRDTTGIDLNFQRVAADGQVLDVLPRHLAYNYSGINNVNIAYGGGCYLAVWDDMDNIWGARIRPDGTVLDPNGFHICADDGQQFEPSVASDGHRFLVSWTDGRTGNYDIYATFVDSAAHVGVAENLTSPVSDHLSLDISPIPFNNQVRIKFNYPLQNNFSLNIYDITGKLVKFFPPGFQNNIIWDGKDNQGNILPDGAYFCRLHTKNQIITKRIIKLE